MAASSSAASSSAAEVTPPDKFGHVESLVYRSAYPTPVSFGFLKMLGLRTVANLSQELPMWAV